MIRKYEKLIFDIIDIAYKKKICYFLSEIQHAKLRIEKKIQRRLIETTQNDN